MHLSLRQLEAFSAVARHASFTKAAEQLHVTQAGLSAMVRELESQAGCRLFERTTRRVSLTEAGERLLPVARRSLQELTQALRHARAAGEADTRQLRVGLTPLMASSVAPRVLAAMAHRHPAARIVITDVDRDVIRQRVEAGELDVGLGAFFGRAAGIRRRPLLAARLMLALPNGAAKTGDAVRWSDVPSDDLLALPAENPIQRLAERHLRPGAVAERRVVTHLETALALVAQGLGHAIVPSFAASAAARWPLQLLPLTPVARCDYYAITRAGVPASDLAEAFLAEFIEACA